MNEKHEQLQLLPTPQELASLGKKDLQALGLQRAKNILDAGALNELEAYIRLRKLAEFVEAMGKGLKEKAEEEARREQPKGAFEKFGAKVTHTSAASKWVYDNCGDPVLDQLLQNLKVAQDAVKERQAFLQGVPETGIEVLDPVTGEVSSVRRAVKVAGAEGISITF